MGAFHADVVDHSTIFDSLYAGSVRHGSRPWPIDHSLAQYGLDLWAVGAYRAPYSWKAQQRSSKDSALNWHERAERRWLRTLSKSLYWLA